MVCFLLELVRGHRPVRAVVHHGEAREVRVVRLVVVAILQGEVALAALFPRRAHRVGNRLSHISLLLPKHPEAQVELQGGHPEAGGRPVGQVRGGDSRGRLPR